MAIQFDKQHKGHIMLHTVKIAYTMFDNEMAKKGLQIKSNLMSELRHERRLEIMSKFAKMEDFGYDLRPSTKLILDNALMNDYSSVVELNTRPQLSDAKRIYEHHMFVTKPRLDKELADAKNYEGLDDKLQIALNKYFSDYKEQKVIEYNAGILTLKYINELICDSLGMPSGDPVLEFKHDKINGIYHITTTMLISYDVCQLGGIVKKGLSYIRDLQNENFECGISNIKLTIENGITR